MATTLICMGLIAQFYIPSLSLEQLIIIMLPVECAREAAVQP